MPFGKSNPIRNQCNTLTLDLEETRTPGRRLTLEARAYNDGVAFRYVLPEQATLKEVRISGERTEFQLAKESTTYPLLLPGFHSPYEDDYHTLPVSGIHPDYLIGLPLLAEVPGVAWVAITEADIENYPGMYLVHNARDARSLLAKLAPSMEEPGIAVQTATPMRSPWRVLMIGGRSGTAGGIEHGGESESAERDRGYVVDQARQDIVGLVVGQVVKNVPFKAA